MAAPRGRRRNGSDGDDPGVGTTGRLLVVLDDQDLGAGLQMLRTRAAVRETVSAAEAPDGFTEGVDAMVFPELGVAVVDAGAERDEIVRGLVDTSSAIVAVEAERYVHAYANDYSRGYRDGVADLVARLELEAGGRAAVPAEIEATEAHTWGLVATGVPSSTRTGKGIKVAVLDTGIDTGHPDFAGRKVTTRSFVMNQVVQDRNGHGTHCCGTAMGPLVPATSAPRYGVAHEALLHAGKVLSDQGSGTDSSILAGINWAISSGCVIISMSLGAPTAPGQAYSRVYETVGRRALARGVLIVAAAGNESARPFAIKPVGHPANCPSIMAVAAVDPQLRVAPFSCGAINGNGGEVDIAGPGVAVDSAWPRPRQRNTISGTSMATPHVAGIAALWAQSDPSLRGRALWNKLVSTAETLSFPASDVGAGLVRAPS